MASRDEALRIPKREARQARIIEAVALRGFASVEHLAAELDVTTQTIRRDITELSAKGQLHRYHGGAGLTAPIDAAVYRTRQIQNVEAKRRIAARAAELIPDGASLYIDCGTTMEAVAHALVAKQGLTIVTNNLRVANHLAEKTDFRIAIPAGFVRNGDGSIFGDTVQGFIGRFRYDFALISVSAVDQAGHLMNDNYDEVQVARAGMAQARAIIVAVDASKFGQHALVEVGTVAEIDGLVTELPPPAALADLLARETVRLHLA